MNRRSILAFKFNFMVFDKAIAFILESQYPLGGWPQRYPLKYEYSKNGNPDYTSYYTFNDDVIWENINFLIQCYLTLGEERLLVSIPQRSARIPPGTSRR